MELAMIWVEKGMESNVDYGHIISEILDLYEFGYHNYVSIEDIDESDSAFKVANFFIPTIEKPVLSFGEIKDRVKEFLEDRLAFYLDRLLPITDVLKFVKDLYETLRNTGELEFMFAFVTKQVSNYYDLWDLPFVSDISDNIECVLTKTISLVE